MSRIAKWLFRIAAVLVLAVLALSIAVAVFTRTDRFRELLRAQIAAIVDASIRGRVTVGPVEGSIWDTLRLSDVVIRDDEGRVANVERIEASASLWPLLHGGAPVIAVDIVSPHLHLVQRDDGSWNAEAAFAPPEPVAVDAEQGNDWLRLAINPLRIRGGEVRIAQPGGRARIRHLSADAEAQITPLGFAAKVESMRAKLLAYGSPPAELSGGLTYDSASQRLDVDDVALRTLRSSLQVDGRLEENERLEARAEVHLSPLDVRSLAASSPLAAPVRGAIEASGTLDDLRADAKLEAAGGSVDAHLTADLAADEPRYDVEAAASEIRLGELLEGDQVSGRLGAYATAHGRGTDPGAITVQASLEVGALALGNRSAGDLSAVASLEKRTLTVEAKTRGGPARIDLASTVELGEPLRYRATAAIDKLDPAVLAGGKAPPHGDLNLRLAVDGAGTALETARAQAKIELQKSRVGNVRIDSGLLQASLADRRVQIGALRLVANGTSLDASGEIGTASDASGRVSYSLKVENLRPWLELAGQAGGGRLDVDGSAEGSLPSLALRARLAGSKLEAAGVAAEEATAEVELAGLDLVSAKTPAPRGSIDLSLRRVSGEVSFARIDAGVELRGAEPASVEVTTRDDAGRTQQAKAEVDYAGKERRVRFTEIALETPAGEWRLAVPATVTQEGESLALDGLVLRNGDESIEARGRLAPSLDLTAAARNVDLSFLNAFQNREAGDFAGRLDVDLEVMGTTARPVASGALHLAGGAVHARSLGVPIHDVTVDLSLAGEELRVDTFTARAGDGSVAANGSLGLAGYAPRALAVDVRIENWPAIDTRRYRATIGGDLSIGGSLEAPQVRGTIDVLHASLHPDLAILNEQAVERDPTIVVVGREEEQPPALAEGQEPAVDEGPPALYDAMSIDLTVRIPRDTWVRHPDAQVELQGEVHAQKSPGAPLRLVGKLETVRGWLAFRGRRFNLQDGQIRFAGGEPIDPALSVVAEHRFPEYDVEIVVGGTVSRPTLTLRSDPSLPEADVLALILFGKPVGQLGKGEQESLGKQAATIAGNYAVGELAQSVTSALGLEELGIDIRQVDVEGGTVGFGKYLTDKTYVAIDQSVTGGTKVTVEYEIYPRVKVQTSTTSEGESEGGVFWKKRY